MPVKPRKVYYADFGCRLNQFETRVLENSGTGMSIKTPSVKNADVIVINTCTVTGRADMKNRQAIRKARAENPEAEIIVTGCYATTESDINSIKQMGENIVVVPNNLKFTIPEIIEKKEPEKNPTVFPPARQTKESSARAYLKIQDGCNKKCSYCKIPSARGKGVSRNFDNTIDEVYGLISSGFKEIILTGVNIGHFHADGKNLKDLLREVGKIQGDQYYRISSIEAECVDREMIEIIADRKFAGFLHIPLQSGSNRVLRSMRRGYTVEKFKATIDMIREIIPDIHIGTDIMAGFPGETEDEFGLTIEAIKSMKFANVHVFPFSKRPGSEVDNKVKSKTPGFEEVNGKVIKTRVKKIISVQKNNDLEYIKNTAGKKYRGIVENVFKDHVEIVTENYVRGKMGIKNTVYKKGDMVIVSYDPELVFNIRY